METTYDTRLVESRSAWGAVFSMALCVAVLIASEFLPVSLLTPMATDLGISEGQTGQAISISGAFAVLTSLLVAGFTRRIDRRLVVSGFTVLLIVSGLAVTFAPNYAMLMVGRALLGVAIGGFLVDVHSHRHAAGLGGHAAEGPDSMGVSSPFLCAANSSCASILFPDFSNERFSQCWQPFFTNPATFAARKSLTR